MERLTEKHYAEKGYYMKCSETCCKLSNCDTCDSIADIVDRLGEYEDAEAKGLLVRLPCKVGDTLYEPTGRKTISEYKVKAIRVELFSVWIEWDIISGFVYRSLYGIEATEIGKTVFLTHEEAETALKEG